MKYLCFQKFQLSIVLMVQELAPSKIAFGLPWAYWRHPAHGNAFAEMHMHYATCIDPIDLAQCQIIPLSWSLYFVKERICAHRWPGLFRRPAALCSYICRFYMAFKYFIYLYYENIVILLKHVTLSVVEQFL